MSALPPLRKPASGTPMPGYPRDASASDNTSSSTRKRKSSICSGNRRPQLPGPMWTASTSAPAHLCESVRRDLRRVPRGLCVASRADGCRRRRCAGHRQGHSPATDSAWRGGRVCHFVAVQSVDQHKQCAGKGIAVMWHESGQNPGRHNQRCDALSASDRPKFLCIVGAEG